MESSFTHQIMSVILCVTGATLHSNDVIQDEELSAEPRLERPLAPAPSSRNKQSVVIVFLLASTVYCVCSKK